MNVLVAKTQIAALNGFLTSEDYRKAVLDASPSVSQVAAHGGIRLEPKRLRALLNMTEAQYFIYFVWYAGFSSIDALDAQLKLVFAHPDFPMLCEEYAKLGVDLTANPVTEVKGEFEELELSGPGKVQRYYGRKRIPAFALTGKNSKRDYAIINRKPTSTQWEWSPTELGKQKLIRCLASYGPFETIAEAKDHAIQQFEYATQMNAEVQKDLVARATKIDKSDLGDL
jgi:hypothetical protein